MKEALVHSEVAYFPKKVYDSDGEGDGNWQDDALFEEPGDGIINETLWAYSKDEGKVNRTNKEKVLKLKQQFGKSTVLARIAA